MTDGSTNQTLQSSVHFVGPSASSTTGDLYRLFRSKWSTRFKPWRNPVSRHALPETPPVPNARPAVVDLVVEDLRQRSEAGVKKYGTKLQPHNGRSALVDLYQELLDAAMYIRQLLEEQAGGRLHVSDLKNLYTPPGYSPPTLTLMSPTDYIKTNSTPLAAGERNVLREAEGLVDGSRGDAYGHPFDDFERTATATTAFLKHKLKPDCKFVAEDVALFMICAKLSREMNRPKHDNLVDAAGYIYTWDKVKQERVRRG